MNKAGFVIMAILLFFISAMGMAQIEESWVPERDQDGIKIFSAKSDDSDFKSFKAYMQLQGSIHTFVAILLDVDNLQKWTSNVKYADLLERNGDTLQIYYSQASAPFPFKNRDGIYLNRIKWNDDSNTLLVDIEMLPDYIEKKDGLVRVEGKGYWQVSIAGPNLLDITFSMLINPGGSIPAWLANTVVDDAPFYTLSKLREMFEIKKYQEQHFDFIPLPN